VSPSERQALRHLGARIKAARQDAELTQEQAAHIAGIDLKRWQRIEAGQVNCTVKTLVRVAQATGTDVYALFKRPRRSAS
jgi:transcriptional regulator with XRE-family HTH domain